MAQHYSILQSLITTDMNSLPIIFILIYPIGTIVWYLIDTKIMTKK